MKDKEIITKSNYKQLLQKHLVSKKLKNIFNDLEIEFLSIDNSITLFSNVYKKINDLNDNIKISTNFNDSLKNISSSKELFNNYSLRNAVLFLKDFRETGAVKIRLEIVFKYLYEICEISGFKEGKFDFICVDENLSYGICIENYEYYKIFAKWIN